MTHYGKRQETQNTTPTKADTASAKVRDDDKSKATSPPPYNGPTLPAKPGMLFAADSPPLAPGTPPPTDTGCPLNST